MCAAAAGLERRAAWLAEDDKDGDEISSAHTRTTGDGDGPKKFSCSGFEVTPPTDRNVPHTLYEVGAAVLRRGGRGRGVVVGITSQSELVIAFVT